MQQILNDIYQFFAGNPALNIISLILAIAGVILSFVFYKKSTKNKRPVFIVRTINLIRENIKKIDTVEILYKGSKIDNLSITKLALWNDGKETINFEDVATNSPLLVSIDDKFKILEAEILFQKNPANDFKINLSANHKLVLVHFDYFDFEEGLILKLSHTGNSSEDIEVKGTIKTVKQIVRKNLFTSFFALRFSPLKYKSNSKIKKRTLLRIMGAITILLGVVAAFYPTLSAILFSKNIHEVLKDNAVLIRSIPFVVISILYITTGVRMLSRRIPKGFDIFDEEF